jgi:hypothetical protein
MRFWVSVGLRILTVEVLTGGAFKESCAAEGLLRARFDGSPRSEGQPQANARQLGPAQPNAFRSLVYKSYAQNSGLCVHQTKERR